MYSINFPKKTCLFAVFLQNNLIIRGTTLSPKESNLPFLKNNIFLDLYSFTINIISSLFQKNILCVDKFYTKCYYFMDMGNIEFEENNFSKRPVFLNQGSNKKSGILGLFINIGLVKNERQARILTLILSILFFALSAYLLLK